MAAQLCSVPAMLTAFFSAAQSEATARHTGFVRRTSKMTGTLLLALVTFGRWSDATTTVAPWVAKATPCGEHVAVSPEALSQRMNQRALALLPARLRPALAKRHACEPRCATGLCAPFARGHLADRTGFALPESLQDTVPGAGGRAAQAGAHMQLVWEDQHRVFTPFALTPWHMPAQKEIDTVVGCAHAWDLFLVA
jgi:hypothetical protein